MTARYRIALLVAAGSVLGLTACSSRSGTTGPTLDEFRVISQRPLVIPPEYDLRPPAPGKPSPQELQLESSTRATAQGQTFDPNASPGERLLLGKAGADASNANIKAVIDDQFGDIAHKPKSFADRVMFWRKDRPQTQVAMATTVAGGAPSPVDVSAEQKRIDSLTGGAAITILREPPPPERRRLKLPGL